MCKDNYDNYDFIKKLEEAENKRLEKRSEERLNKQANELNMKREMALEMAQERRIYENEYKNCVKGPGEKGLGITFKFVKDINYITKYKGPTIQLINHLITDINYCLYEINISKNYNDWCELQNLIKNVNLMIHDLNYNDNYINAQAIIIVEEVHYLINDLIKKAQKYRLTEAAYKCNFSIFNERLWVKSEEALVYSYKQEELAKTNDSKTNVSDTEDLGESETEEADSSETVENNNIILISAVNYIDINKYNEPLITTINKKIEAINNYIYLINIRIHKNSIDWADIKVGVGNVNLMIHDLNDNSYTSVQIEIKVNEIYTLIENLV
jgi:hypothetical protein